MSSPCDESADTAVATTVQPAVRLYAQTAERNRGLFYGAIAHTMWGGFPLFWLLLKPASPLEILAHRIVWSLFFVALLLAAGRRFGALRQLLRRPRAVAALAGAAVLMGVNWGTYIYGVNSGQVVQTSLGYFITPLVTVVFAVVVLRESLRRVQWVAVGLGGLSVALLTADYGRPPWIALTLGVCFGGYGLLKKAAGSGAVEGLAVETAVLAGPALGWIAWLGVHDTSTFNSEGTGHALLLLMSGIVTTVPLIFFGAAAVRLPLTTMGMLQYLAPVLQLLIGVVVLREPMPAMRLAGFALVWSAILVLVLDGWRGHRKNSSDPARQRSNERTDRSVR